MTILTLKGQTQPIVTSASIEPTKKSLKVPSLEHLLVMLIKCVNGSQSLVRKYVKLHLLTKEIVAFFLFLFYI